jgi:putative ATPase
VTRSATGSSLSLPGGRSFEVVEGDLLAQDVDAIVNAANGRLMHGGGVAAAIARAAGAALREEGERILAQRGPIPTGEAVVTTAGALPFAGVVHAVGPAYGEGGEEEKLVCALASAFERAAERGWARIAFPAVSSGIFAVPLPTCARAYVRAVREHVASRPKTSLQLFRLCVFDPQIVKLVREEMQR